MTAFAGTAEASLLLIFGADDDARIVRNENTIKIGCTSDIFGLIQDQLPFHRLQMTRNFFRQARRPDLSPYYVLINLITEPERNGRVLENLRRFLRETSAKVLNPPEAVLKSTRDQVASRLSGIEGLVVPRIVRLKSRNGSDVASAVGRAGLPYPLILRETGTHKGRIVGRFDDPESLLGVALESGEHLATEFIDFRSADGLYRKYRVFFIGDQLILRHMLVSDHWNIHAADRTRFMADRPELVAEEESLFDGPEAAPPRALLEALRDVRRRMPLDFFGMDFGLLPDGRLVLFEANASMNFFPFLPDPRFDYVKRCFKPARRAFRELIGLKPASSLDLKLTS